MGNRNSLRAHAKLKAMGEALGREGMSLRVIDAVNEFHANGGTFRGAIYLAGRLKAIAAMATADEYWREKMLDGFEAELHLPLPQREGSEQ